MGSGPPFGIASRAVTHRVRMARSRWFGSASAGGGVAAGGHRAARVAARVEEGERGRVRIGERRGGVGGGAVVQFGGGADGGGDAGAHAGGERAEAHRLRFERLAAGKAEQALDEGFGAI